MYFLWFNLTSFVGLLAVTVDFSGSSRVYRVHLYLITLCLHVMSLHVWYTYPTQYTSASSLLSLFYCCHAQLLGHVWPFVASWTVAYQAPLSMEFSRQESWSGVPFLSQGDLPDPAIKPTSLCLLHWQVDSLPLAPPRKTYTYCCQTFYLYIVIFV